MRNEADYTELEDWYVTDTSGKVQTLQSQTIIPVGQVTTTTTAGSLTAVGITNMGTGYNSQWQNVYYPPTPSVEDMLEKLWENTAEEGIDISLKDLRRLLNMCKENEGLKELVNQVISLFRLLDDGEDEGDALNNALRALQQAAAAYNKQYTYANPYTNPSITVGGPLSVGSCFGGQTSSWQTVQTTTTQNGTK